MSKLTVVLNAGHGGKDPGALGHNLKEKDINLSVTLKVGELLKKQGVKVVYTRDTDRFHELHEISKISNNNKPDLFISIHCNAFSDPKAQGFEVFHYPCSAKGQLLAVNIMKQITSDKTLVTKNRGVKTASFAVLKRTIAPAALVELGFITNKEDAEILKNKQDGLALSIAKGTMLSMGKIYQEEEREKEPEKSPEDELKESVQVLVEAGVLNSPSLWVTDSPKRLEWINGLINNMANYINKCKK